MEMGRQEKLGEKLFGLVKRDQGYAFISDAVGELPDERVLAIARGALKHSEAVVMKLRKFLKEHDKQYKRCIAGCGGCERNMDKDHQCTRESGHITEHRFTCERPVRCRVSKPAWLSEGLQEWEKVEDA
jgi:hypothetical protein